MKSKLTIKTGKIIGMTYILKPKLLIFENSICQIIKENKATFRFQYDSFLYKDNSLNRIFIVEKLNENLMCVLCNPEKRFLRIVIAPNNILIRINENNIKLVVNNYRWGSYLGKNKLHDDIKLLQDDNSRNNIKIMNVSLDNNKTTKDIKELLESSFKNSTLSFIDFKDNMTFEELEKYFSI